METAKLKKFAQFARRSLLEQVSAKLKLVLAENSAARRENPRAVTEIEKQIFGAAGQYSDQRPLTGEDSHRQAQLVDRVAYIWFNRFCALRFMDVNRYNRVNIVSPADPGQFQPEILAEAKMGHIDDEMVHDKVRQQIFALLNGKAPSRDPQGEAYRLLVVAACNFWNKSMPFLFPYIADYTELLMPDDLLSGNSILAYTREAMTPDICGVENEKWEVGCKNQTAHSPLLTTHSAAAGGVEVIGWLYQFYISEKKDEVFDGLKKNKKITPENIPAATQLFTPHWIVKYLVENSLGRLWMLNRPNSRLIDKMEYYIRPDTSVGSEKCEVGSQDDSSHAQLPASHLKISSPEEIRICDPACGSGHMLTYAFDLLHAIYEEEGVDPAEIPEKILTHNLYGIEIDERAGELAAFALTMKARAKQRRFFNKGVKPNICVLENVRFDEGELKEVGSEKWVVGSEKQQALHHDLRLFEEADNFGSLLRPQLPLEDIDALQKTIHSILSTNHSLFDSMTHQKVLQALRQANYLSSKYHVVIANPPYMGAKGMNAKMASLVKVGFPEAKADLFAAFWARIGEVTISSGEIGIITPYVWMFLSSYEDFRHALLKKAWITSLTQLEYNAFAPATIPVCLFTLHNSPNESAKGVYIRLTHFRGVESQGPKTLQAIRNADVDWRYSSTGRVFKEIPGAPIAYWITDRTREAFASQKSIGASSELKQGLITGDNDRFIRYWYETSQDKCGLRFENRDQAKNSKKKWFPFQKGGSYRKWYGNHEYLVNWGNDGEEIKNFVDKNGKLRSRPQSIEYYFWVYPDSPICSLYT